ncbi:recombination-associated protein RdgC [Paucibacter soli]|uniref:recombination-associated protein RdgC n=1 Tax=Paucibacter soli TaxID=3133433 RepID=UPI0030B01659
MFKQFTLFRFPDDWTVPAVSAIEEALGLARFAPTGPTQREAVGWIEPRGEKHGPLIESIGGHLILKLMTEVRKLPASAVKDKLAERIEKLKEERGLQRVGAAMKKELKEQIELEMLPHCFTSKGATLIWIDPAAKTLVVAAGAVKKADRIISMMIDAFTEIGDAPSIRPLNTQTSPSTAMSDWLATQEPPQDFTVDRECELKSGDGEKSVVRYSRHTLDIQEVVEHIKLRGKTPTKLAITFMERVSCVLCEDLSIKKVKFLDVAFESTNKADSGFDADVAIATGELSKFIKALVEVLGGEFQIGAGGEVAAVSQKSGPETPSAATASPFEAEGSAAEHESEAEVLA